MSSIPVGATRYGSAPGVLRSATFPWVTVGGRTGATSAARGEEIGAVRLSEVVGALSFALDLTEGQQPGHAVRTTLIGMKIASLLALPDEQRSALYYALLLKDLGCSSNAARVCTLFGSDDQSLKRAFKLTDWTAARDAARYAYRHALPGRSGLARAWHMLMLGLRERGSLRTIITTRCERGGDIARMLGLPPGTAEAIHALDEHWDGGGLPLGLGGSAIPILARIAGLAQTVDVFQQAFDVRTAYEMARARRGSWFDPVAVDCLAAFELDATFWRTLREGDLLKQLSAVEPDDRILRCDDAQLDRVAEAFAQVIDAKSPYTARHSENVAAIAVPMGESAGLNSRELRTLRRAALLHDIGKLGVSNRILDKSAPLDDTEWEAVRQHTQFTFDILKRVSRFRQFAATAAAHHERLNGSGYHLGLHHSELGVSARILAVADVAEALLADRPYRTGLPLDEATRMMANLVNKHHLCPMAFDDFRATFRVPDRPATAPECLVA